MDDQPWVHYTVRYSATYAEPQIDSTLLGIVQDVQFGMITLLVYQLFSVFVNIDELDPSKYEKKKTSPPGTVSEKSS